ncbi:MAG: hydantoinase B/oxoprolinase family protein [Candidatus Dormibacteria bacterium]
MIESRAGADSRLDPVTQAVLAGGLAGAVAEMKATVVRSAYSPLWREAGDLSCGLLAPNAEIVAQGLGDIPIHLASMPLSLLGCLARFPIESLEPGDVVIQNDPYGGNNHLPDFVMAKPVFHSGHVVAFSVVRGHWVDVGGAARGSYVSDATEIFAEGIRIPPVRLYRAGEIDEDILAVLGANVRNARERLGDLRAQYAGCAAGEVQVLSLCDRYGAEVVERGMNAVLDSAERRARRAIEGIPDGCYTFRDTCDGGGGDSKLISLAATVTVEGDGIVVDFTGSSAQVAGNRNAPLAVTMSATYFAIKAVTEPTTPSNSGSYRPVTVIAPAGSVVNPDFPAAVALGNHETAARIADVVLGALAEAAPDRVCAAGAGSSCVVIVSGMGSGNVGGGEPAIMYEVHGAAQGASCTRDGSNALRTGIGNTGNTPTEVLESVYPVFVEGYGVTLDAGGAGRQRGGCGITRTMRFTGEASVTIAADRSESAPYGLAGGSPGRMASFTLVGSAGGERTLGSGATVRVGLGDRLTIRTAGGGGYGPPNSRVASALREDVEDGYVSRGACKTEYARDFSAIVDGAEGSAVASSREPVQQENLQ